MNNLVSLEQAKAQLRIVDTDSDNELTSVMIPGASAVVAAYLKWPAAWPYTADTLPPDMVTAVLLVLASLYEDREGANDPVGPAVASILRPYRDPTLA